jgi:Sec-independent protein translocase protein TatA
MGFFGIGIGEILLVLVFSLIIWGPKRMIEIARTLGKLVHTLRKVTSDLTAAVTKEMDGEKDNSPQQQNNSTNDARQIKTPRK